MLVLVLVVVLQLLTMPLTLTNALRPCSTLPSPELRGMRPVSNKNEVCICKGNSALGWCSVAGNKSRGRTKCNSQNASSWECRTAGAERSNCSRLGPCTPQTSSQAMKVHGLSSDKSMQVLLSHLSSRWAPRCCRM